MLLNDIVHAQIYDFLRNRRKNIFLPYTFLEEARPLYGVAIFGDECRKSQQVLISPPGADEMSDEHEIYLYDFTELNNNSHPLTGYGMRIAE